MPILHRTQALPKTRQRLHPNTVLEHQALTGTKNLVGLQALRLEQPQIGLAGDLGCIHPEHHGRRCLGALEQILPVAGILFFELGHPPGLVVVAGELGLQGGLHQGVFFPQKTPQHRIQKCRLGLGVQLLFGGLHRLVDQGVGLIGADIGGAHQRKRRAQQLVDRDGRFFADQEASNDAGTAPLAQCQEQERLHARLEPRIQAFEDLRARVSALDFTQGACRGPQELPQRQ